VVWHVLSDPVSWGSNIDVVDEEGRERIKVFLFPFDGERTCCQSRTQHKADCRTSVAKGVAELELVLGDGHMDVGLCVIWVVVRELANRVPYPCGLTHMLTVEV
jgi:hypothetical protein